MRIFVQINLAGEIIVAIKIAENPPTFRAPKLGKNASKSWKQPRMMRRRLRGLRCFRQEIRFSEIFFS